MTEVQQLRDALSRADGELKAVRLVLAKRTLVLGSYIGNEYSRDPLYCRQILREEGLTLEVLTEAQDLLAEAKREAVS